MVSIIEWLLVVNTFQKPPKSWLSTKQELCILSREVNGRTHTVYWFQHVCENMNKYQFLTVLGQSL